MQSSMISGPIGSVRKLLSILLLAVFSLTFIAPLFAMAGQVDGGVPICCRREGKHHCGMSMTERSPAAPRHPQVHAPLDRCPFCPKAMPATHPDVSTSAVSASVLAALVSHPAGIAQTESKWRISRDRSRQKRGPPAFVA